MEGLHVITVNELGVRIYSMLPWQILIQILILLWIFSDISECCITLTSCLCSVPLWLKRE